MGMASPAQDRLAWDIWYCRAIVPVMYFLAAIGIVGAGFFLVRLNGDIERLWLVVGNSAGAFFCHLLARFLKRRAMELETQLSAVNSPAQNPDAPPE